MAAEIAPDRFGIRIRGTQVSRLEGISDAVFGLAITLIVVTLQVPKTFTELLLTLKGFLGSGLCTLILLQIWDRHYLFFRRYGLEDGVTRFLNGTLLFVVIAYVYPLKFLFTAFFDSLFGIHIMGINLDYRDLPSLFVIYGIGFCIVYFLFGQLYRHALKLSNQLELTELEAFQTKWIMAEHFLMGCTGLVSVALALMLPIGLRVFAGFGYFLIPVILTILWSKHGAQLRRMRSEQSSLNADETPA